VSAAPARRPFFLVTCEHGGNRTPAPFDAIFRGHRRLLATHRGYDAGALELGQALARTLHAPYVRATVSRLIVELNRPPGDPAFHSTLMRAAPERLRALAVRRYYEPHRRRIEDLVASAIDEGRNVVHIGAHSFAPVRNGVRREAEVGLLFDPGRQAERAFCAAWRRGLRAVSPRWRVRFNYPYKGSDPGLTTELRAMFPAARYAGIELEMNQRLVRAGPESWARACERVTAALERALSSPRSA
jgi:predicted N-formylglutamate amidohydrolase